MNNKQWNSWHKENIVLREYDKDLVKFIKRFYHADKESKNILDLACGQGVDIDYISSSFTHYRCYACDFSQKGLCISNSRLLSRSNVVLKQCDIIKTGYKDDFFDVIYVIDLELDDNMLKEIHRILKLKGRIFIKYKSKYELSMFERVENYDSKDYKIVSIGRKK